MSQDLKVALLNVGGINSDPYEYGLGFFGTSIMEGETSLNNSIKNLFSDTYVNILNKLKRNTDNEIDKLLNTLTEDKINLDFLYEDNGDLKVYKIISEKEFKEPKFQIADRNTPTKLFSGLVMNKASIWDESNMSKLSELIKDKNFNLTEEDIAKIKVAFFKAFSTNANNFNGLPDDKYYIPDPPGVYTKDAKDFDKEVVTVDNATVFFNGGLFAYTYLILDEILKCYKNDNENKLDNNLLFDGPKDIIEKKKSIINELIETYDVVCLNECADDLIEKLEELNVIILKSKLDEEKGIYSAILSKKSINLEKPEQNIDNNMGGEIIHAKANHNNINYNIICHHASSFKGQHKSLFLEQLEKINRIQNLIYCVDSNSPYSVTTDITSKDLILASPSKINELVYENSKEDKNNLKTSDKFNTTNKKRSWLQPQLDKAEQIDKSSKDFIICSDKIKFDEKQSLIKTEAVDTETNNQVSIPNANYPFDHFIVTATLIPVSNTDAPKEEEDNVDFQDGSQVDKTQAAKTQVADEKTLKDGMLKGGSLRKSRRRKGRGRKRKSNNSRKRRVLGRRNSKRVNKKRAIRSRRK